MLATESPHRLLGFSRCHVHRATMPYLAKLLVSEAADPRGATQRLLAEPVRVLRGIALPFSTHQGCLESSPKIQQAIGRLKRALELNAREIEPLCASRCSS